MKTAAYDPNSAAVWTDMVSEHLFRISWMIVNFGSSSNLEECLPCHPSGSSALISGSHDQCSRDVWEHLHFITRIFSPSWCVCPLKWEEGWLLVMEGVWCGYESLEHRLCHDLNTGDVFQCQIWFASAAERMETQFNVEFMCVCSETTAL
jgi:hypothetical protein